MKNFTADASLKRTVKVAGLMFLCSLLVPLLNWIFVLSIFISAESPINTARNILANELLFGAGIMNELITSVILAVLAMALYFILKPVNKNFALLALSLKLIEAILWAVIALGHFIALMILKEQVSLTAIESEQLQAFIGLFLNVHISVTAVPGLFSGLNLLIFSYLLYRSEFVPGLLAGFGVLSYTLVVLYDSLTILSPEYTTMLIMQIICCAPICIFQLIIGIWLCFKGGNFQSQGNTVPVLP